MTKEEFESWDWHKAENLERQRDSAVADLETCKAEVESLTAKLSAKTAEAAGLAAKAVHQEEIAASYSEDVATLKAQHVGELMALRNQHADDLRQLAESHAAEKLREQKIRELNAKIAEIEKLKMELG